MNRSTRRAIERQARSRPPRDRGGRVMCMPLAFAATPAMKAQMGLRDREAIDAVISGQGVLDDLRAAVTVAVTAAHACAIARDTPELAALIDGLEDVRAWLASECMDALVSIFTRLETTGRIGVNGEERTELLTLARIADQIRDVMPRRVLHEAFTRSLKVASLRAALGMSEAAA